MEAILDFCCSYMAECVIKKNKYEKFSDLIVLEERIPNNLIFGFDFKKSETEHERWSFLKILNKETTQEERLKVLKERIPNNLIFGFDFKKSETEHERWSFLKILNKETTQEERLKVLKERIPNNLISYKISDLEFFSFVISEMINFKKIESLEDFDNRKVQGLKVTFKYLDKYYSNVVTNFNKEFYLENNEEILKFLIATSKYQGKLNISLLTSVKLETFEIKRNWLKYMQGSHNILSFVSGKYTAAQRKEYIDTILNAMKNPSLLGLTKVIPLYIKLFEEYKPVILKYCNENWYVWKEYFDRNPNKMTKSEYDSHVQNIWIAINNTNYSNLYTALQSMYKLYKTFGYELQTTLTLNFADFDKLEKAKTALETNDPNFKWALYLPWRPNTTYNPATGQYTDNPGIMVDWDESKSAIKSSSLYQNSYSYKVPEWYRPGIDYANGYGYK
jgi:hypothetical protein